MSSLHVERPTTLTRVSEYIPEIVTFVEGIVARGLAYEGGGSVWFDTAKFEGAEGVEGEEWKHTYAKLQPWSKGNRELLEDGEGAPFFTVVHIAVHLLNFHHPVSLPRIVDNNDGEKIGV